MSEEIAIEIKDIVFKDEEEVILNALSGKIFKNTFTTIIGPSGAGKSTLINFFNGIHSPTSGEIYINNKPIFDYDQMKLRRKVQLVSQESIMIEGTVKDNLELPLKLQKKSMSDKDAEDLLEEVDLDKSYLLDDALELSGGEKQRVALARALANQPSIMLLDEITSALDGNAKSVIEDLLIEIRKKNQVTMIMVTHDLNQAMRLSDNIWVIIDGELVQNGAPHEIKHTNNKEVRDFLGEVE